MSKKIQLKESAAQKRVANVQRSSSYRLALRRSAPPPPESEDLLTGSDDHQNKDHDNSPETDKPSFEDKPVVSQPTNGKKVTIDESINETNGVQTEPLITDHKTNGEKDLKSIEFVENENTIEGENVCTKFCCQTLCFHYCKCCPNCCSNQMKRLESVLIHLTDCGLNCLRVFT